MHGSVKISPPMYKKIINDILILRWGIFHGIRHRGLCVSTDVVSHRWAMGPHFESAMQRLIFDVCGRHMMEDFEIIFDSNKISMTKIG